jgi:hypothetical protein
MTTTRPPVSASAPCRLACAKPTTRINALPVAATVSLLRILLVLLHVRWNYLLLSCGISVLEFACSLVKTPASQLSACAREPYGHHQGGPWSSAPPRRAIPSTSGRLAMVLSASTSLTSAPPSPLCLLPMPPARPGRSRSALRISLRTPTAGAHTSGVSLDEWPIASTKADSRSTAPPTPWRPTTGRVRGRKVEPAT